MAIVVALLRGVNVVGHGKIKMEDLHELCASLKLRDVRTHIQSGNIVFQTTGRDLDRLSLRIADAIDRKHRFRPSVICLTAAGLKEAAARNPFAGRAGLEPSKLGVCFLSSEPSPEARAKLLQLKTEPEELHVGIQELFIYFPNGMGRPKVSMAAVERTAKTPMTVRNWNTVEKLIAIAEEIESGK